MKIIIIKFSLSIKIAQLICGKQKSMPLIIIGTIMKHWPLVVASAIDSVRSIQNNYLLEIIVLNYVLIHCRRPESVGSAIHTIPYE